MTCMYIAAVNPVRGPDCIHAGPDRLTPCADTPGSGTPQSNAIEKFAAGVLVVDVLLQLLRVVPRLHGSGKLCVHSQGTGMLLIRYLLRADLARAQTQAGQVGWAREP